MNNNNNVILKGYITNLQLYTEGQLNGKWIEFPIQRKEEQSLDEAIAEIFESIGINQENCREYFFTDYESSIFGLTECLGEYENIYTLEYLARKIEDIYYSTKQLEAMIEYGEHTDGAEQLIDLVDSEECFYFMPEVRDDFELGYEYAENNGVFASAIESMDIIRNYIDYEAYGRDIRITDGGIFTNNGYISLTDDVSDNFNFLEVIQSLHE